MTTFTHKVQYYETDKMGITHHSNYIRFMEEARTDYLEKIGYDYKKMESEGLMSPVVSVDAEFKKPTTYADVIEIEVKLKAVTSVKIEFGYVMKTDKGIVCTATSTHCFLTDSGRPAAIKKLSPALFELLSGLVEE